ncbi:putative HTH-type transcriptional regulator YvdT [Sporotomaculum syntrophicum]|uniref:HTH-type transcriptional regulator YvdT n=1 Tax=Sporotomaculum syntrophicum TaxID=182264 RepID=A0A9D3AWJ6_9FIRM|nr:TetR/AcrR family transcriptional regulator [Sporotomaculum syntrophicum]KAF1085510.1 putative HTH-type transcriptional regulator YvdT [Sporotomaculum syntrophicum]
MVYHKTEKVLEKQQSRKRKILNAARELLAEKEMGSASIKAIAKKAGIATGTFYLYFKDKDALIDTMLKEIYKELLDLIKKERAPYTNGFDKLEATMKACINMFMSKKNLARILLDLTPQNNAVFNTKFTDIINDLIWLTKIDLDELMEQKLIPEQDTQVSATAFVGAFREVILAWINSDEPLNEEQAYRTLINFNLRGLGKS